MGPNHNQVKVTRTRMVQDAGYRSRGPDYPKLGWNLKRIQGRDSDGDALPGKDH